MLGSSRAFTFHCAHKVLLASAVFILLVLLSKEAAELHGQSVYHPQGPNHPLPSTARNSPMFAVQEKMTTVNIVT